VIRCRLAEKGRSIPGTRRCSARMSTCYDIETDLFCTVFDLL